MIRSSLSVSHTVCVVCVSVCIPECVINQNVRARQHGLSHIHILLARSEIYV